MKREEGKRAGKEREEGKKMLLKKLRDKREAGGRREREEGKMMRGRRCR